MIDMETHKPLEIFTEANAGSYMMVLLPQLDEVQRVLKENGIPFTVAQDAIELDDKSVITFIDLGYDADPVEIQKVLNFA